MSIQVRLCRLRGGGVKECQGCGARSTNKHCPQCRAENRHRKSYPCKQCGVAIIGSEKKPGLGCKRYCSVACRHKTAAEKRTEVQCCVCGKAIIRAAWDLAKRDRFCCGLACQRQLSMVDNHSSNCRDKDWLTASQNAKVKYKQQQSNKRAIQFCRDVRRALANLANRTGARTPEKTWESAILQRIIAGRGRVRHRQMRVSRASGGVYKALARIAQRRRYHELSEWEKRIGNKLSNSTKRRRRKHENKRIKSERDTPAIDATWVQVCFDWMADQSG